MSSTLSKKPPGKKEPRDPGHRVKICHVIVGHVLAGAQRFMLDILDGLDPNRFDRHVICECEGPLTDALRENGITCHLVSTLDRAIRPHRDWIGLLQIRRICLEEGFHIVHTHSSKGGILGRLAARAAGVAGILHHVHGFPFHEYSGRAEKILFSRVEKLAGRCCDKVVFVNHEERELAIREGILPGTKGITVSNGTDLERFEARRNRGVRAIFRSRCGLEDDETAILFCGRLEKQKQPLILPKIAGALESMAPEGKWRMLVVGTGDLKEAVMAETARLGLQHRFNFMDWTSEPHVAVSGADVALLPSLWEGLPLALIEAQAAGIPIVASNVKGNREVVTPNTGYLCAPENPMSYAGALDLLCADPARRFALGAAARRQAEDRFNLQKNLLEIYEIYENLIVRQARKPTAPRLAS